MLGMTREQIEEAVDEWYLNNQDKVSSFIQGFGEDSGDCGDDVTALVSKVMASLGATVALAAVKDILVQNNEVISAQLDALIDAKIAAAASKK